MRRRGFWKPLAIMMVCAHGAHAQATARETLFGKLMSARMDSLALDPAIAARAPGKRGMQLMQAAGDSAMYFLNDDGLRDLSALFAESAARATPEVCARLYTDGGDAFPDAFANMMQSADSLLLDRWASFMARLVRAGIMRSPPGRLASAQEVRANLIDMIARQPLATRERLRRGAMRAGDATDVCLFAKTVYGHFASLPAAQSGPVFRAMMNGVMPRIQ